MSNAPLPPFEISESLRMPLDAVTQRGAFLGSPGSGKSWAAMLLAEQMLDAGAQVIAMDGVGIWWGLRYSADGKGVGKSIVVFGGAHADLPLDSSTGALIADIICDKRLSAVLDLTGMEDEKEVWKFSEEFARRLFFRRQQQPSATALFLEECQEFVAERGTDARGMAEMNRAFRRISKIGRNYGFGVWLISQRPQEISKMVLNLSECVFAFQMQGLAEREAVAKWVASNAGNSDLLNDLPMLPRGTAHVWSPRWLQINETVAIGKRVTFDASRTPVVGAAVVVPQAVTDMDLSAIAKALEAAVRRRDDEDPETLREEIERLKEQLAAGGQIAGHSDEDLEREYRRGVAEAEERLKNAVANALYEFTSGIAMLEEIVGNEPAVVDQIDRTDQTDVVTGEPSRNDQGTTPVPVIEWSKPAESPADAHQGNDELNGPARRILSALRQLEAVRIKQPKRIFVAMLSGYSNLASTGFVKAMSFLNARGYIASSDGRVTLLEKGRAATEPAKRPMNSAGLQSQIMEMLPGVNAKVLRLVIAAYPKPITRDKLMKESGYTNKASTGFVKALSRLSSLELVEYPAPGMVLANKELFI